MMRKTTVFCMLVTVSVFLSACDDGNRSFQGLSSAQFFGWRSAANGTGGVFKVASQLESAADRLFASPFPNFKQLTVSNQSDMQSCDLDDTAVVTIYSTNGAAQTEIDVMLDNRQVGSLKTYFPDDEPSCRSPSAEGVITLMVPAGEHTLEAKSNNLNWPSHVFSVDKCVCMVLPLS